MLIFVLKGDGDMGDNIPDTKMKNEVLDWPIPFSIQRHKLSCPHHMPKFHFHENYELYYLLSGEKTYYIKDRVYRAARGDLVFINEYELHRTASTGPSLERERILLYFKKELFADAMKDLLHDPCSPLHMDSPVLSLSVQEQQIVEELLYKIDEEFHIQRKAYIICLKGLMLELMAFLLRCIEVRQGGKHEKKQLPHLKVSEIIRFLEQNFTESVSLKVISDQFELSPCYLSRLFKNSTGIHFVDYITMLRVKEAQKLLRDTDMKVVDISEQAGFDNLAHFYRVFRKRTSASPLEYRSRQRR